LCEDCLPEGEIAAAGSTIPELEVLGYGEISQAYWIYCEDCQKRAKTDRVWNKSWEEEERQAQATAASMRPLKHH